MAFLNAQILKHGIFRLEGLSSSYTIFKDNNRPNLAEERASERALFPVGKAGITDQNIAAVPPAIL